MLCLSTKVITVFKNNLPHTTLMQNPRMAARIRADVLTMACKSLQWPTYYSPFLSQDTCYTRTPWVPLISMSQPRGSLHWLLALRGNIFLQIRVCLFKVCAFHTFSFGGLSRPHCNAVLHTPPHTHNFNFLFYGFP